MLSRREWMKQNAEKYPDHVTLARACRDALGCKKTGSLHTLAVEIKGGGDDDGEKKGGSSGPRRRTFEQLQQTHDLSYQIPKAIEEIRAEYLVDGGWLMDTEMLTEVCARVPRARSRWAHYRDREEYEAMQARTPDGKLIWIDPTYRERAERMRAQ